MVIKKHIDDVQPATVDEHFQLILNDRSIIDTEFVKVTTNDIPEWYDDRLFKIGQKYYTDNLLGCGASHLTGLVAITSVPDILKILAYTKQSSTVRLSYKRFAETLLLMYALFHLDILDPNSKWFQAMNAIRWRHANVNKRRVQEGLHGIYQKDMAITQYGFIGYILVCPERVGLGHSTEEERMGFNHLWRVTGHLLGISDRINICRASVAETLELCRRIKDEILVKHLQEPLPDFLQLTSNMVSGLWYVDWSIDKDAFFYFTYDITGVKYMKPIGWYSYLNMKQREWILYFCSVPYIGWVVRNTFNFIVLMTYWILENYPLIPWLAFGKSASLHLYPKI